MRRRRKLMVDWTSNVLSYNTSYTIAYLGSLATTFVLPDIAPGTTNSPQVSRFTVQRIVGEILVSVNGATLPAVGNFYSIGTGIYHSGLQGTNPLALDPLDVGHADASWMWLRHDIIGYTYAVHADFTTDVGLTVPYIRIPVDIKSKRVLRGQDAIVLAMNWRQPAGADPTASVTWLPYLRILLSRAV